MNEFGCVSKGAYHIMERLACLQIGHTLCGCAYGLEYDGDRSLFPVIVTDSKRDSLPHLVDLYDDEFAWLAVLSNARSFHNHEENFIRQLPRLNNRIHIP